MFSYFAGSVLHVGWPKPCFLRAKTKPKTPPRCAAPRSVEPVGKKWGTTSVLAGWYLIELLINTGWKNFLIGYCSLLGRRRMVPQLRIVNNRKKTKTPTSSKSHSDIPSIVAEPWCFGGFAPGHQIFSMTKGRTAPHQWVTTTIPKRIELSSKRLGQSKTLRCISVSKSFTTHYIWYS